MVDVMTWQDYFVGKFMWEVVFPFGILIAILVGYLMWLIADEFVIRPLKDFFKRSK